MGRRLEQAQLISSETSHLIVMHAGDARTVTTSGYLLVDGTLYVVDYLQDPRAPRPKMWTEIYAHVERTS